MKKLSIGDLENHLTSWHIDAGCGGYHNATEWVGDRFFIAKEGHNGPELEHYSRDEMTHWVNEANQFIADYPEEDAFEAFMNTSHL